jgi:hypothetical protein
LQGLAFHSGEVRQLARLGPLGDVAFRTLHLTRPESPQRSIGREHIIMKIAQVAPLYESVPPKFYGGTERVVSYITEEFVKLGHEITLYASGDSKTSARLRSV